MATTSRRTTPKAKAGAIREAGEILADENPMMEASATEAAAFGAEASEAPTAEIPVAESAYVEAEPAPVEMKAEPAPEVVKTEVPAESDGADKSRAAGTHAAKSRAAETAHALEGSFNAASKSLQVFSAKAMEAYQANAAASMDYMKALSGVRTVSEAIALQSEHMRKQYESLTSQAKELTSLAQQVAADAAGPLKDQFGKGFKSST
jgi:phasin